MVKSLSTASLSTQFILIFTTNVMVLGRDTQGDNEIMMAEL
jgi:hypothetical protein